MDLAQSPAARPIRIGEFVAFDRHVMLLTFPRPGVLPSGDHRPIAVRVAARVQLLVSSGRQALCALRGHEMMLQFESNRLSLRCWGCGAESPGWQLDANSGLRCHRPRIVTRRAGQSEHPARERSVIDMNRAGRVA
jgi:hypothetical protein